MPRSKIARAFAHPVRLLPLTFLTLILLGTVLLLLPFARAGEESPEFLDAFFTATSATTITGLSVVDTGTYWSTAGLVIIYLLVQAGAFGIVGLGTLVGVFIGGRLGVTTRLTAQTDTHVGSMGAVGPLLKQIAIIMFGIQAVTAVILLWRYRTEYHDNWLDSIGHALFDAAMAFANAGFSLNPDSLRPYTGDWLVIVTFCTAVFIGAIGFPVLSEFWAKWRRPSTWTIHTKLTIWGSILLLVAGFVLFLLFEWSNTIADATWSERFLAALEGTVMPRSGGLNTFDWAHVSDETKVISTVLMFIGGGSASTAGGIKVTTFLLLAFVILAELRGDPEVSVGNRRVGPAVIRTALTIALMSVMLVVVPAFYLMARSDFAFQDVLFEVTSAFGTVGLTTGVTAGVPDDGKVVLAFLMFIGRVGTITAASAFILRRRPKLYRLPEEQPIIG